MLLNLVLDNRMEVRPPLTVWGFEGLNLGCRLSVSPPPPPPPHRHPIQVNILLPALRPNTYCPPLSLVGVICLCWLFFFPHFASEHKSKEWGEQCRGHSFSFWEGLISLQRPFLVNRTRFILLQLLMWGEFFTMTQWECSSILYLCWIKVSLN